MDTRQRQQTSSKINRNTSGFTLVELVVVLVVLIIICTLSVLGINAWQDHADFKKQNEYAQNIFVATQTQLTQYGERGQLTALKDAITNDGTADGKDYLLDAQGVLTADGAGDAGNSFQASDESIWQKDKTGNAKRGDIYFLKVKKGDYSKYQELKTLSAAEMKKRTAQERRIRALYDMLDPYIADKSMLDAAICVEFDPDPKVALVYSVFYNEKVNEFTYAKTDDALSGTVSILDRRADARNDKKIGYYGAEVLAKGTDVNMAKPVISNVRLNNKDTLSLTWSTNSAEALTRLIFEINLFAPSESGIGAGTKVAYLVLGKVDQLDLVLSGENRIRGVYNRQVKNATGTWDWEETELEFPFTINKAERTMTLVLDGFDLSADEGSNAITLGRSAGIRRLGLNHVENLYASVSGSRSGTYKKTVEKQSNTEHQLFGKIQTKVLEDGSTTRIYSIENARHLNNIRYMEQSNITSSSQITYRMVSDIDWEETVARTVIYRETEVIVPASEQLRFKPILMLRENSTLLTEELDSPYQLKNFSFQIEDVPQSNDYPVTIPEGTLGLFVVNQGTIKNLILTNVTVSGKVDGGATGAFCGENRGSLENLTVQSGLVTGGTRVGGITGSITGSGTYQKLTNRAFVSGYRYVGGIAGSIMSAQGTLTVEDCVNYGKVTGVAREGSDAYYIGGITGFSEAKADAMVMLRRCSSSPSYAEDEIRDLTKRIQEGDTSDLVGTYVGGIVGFNQGAQLVDCNTLRERADIQGYVVGNQYVGGIVGFNSGTENSQFSGNNNRNQANVIGESYIGGITGCNAKGTLNLATNQITITWEPTGQPTLSAWINEGVVLAAGNYAGGITGFNYGQLLDCNSNVEYTSAAQELITSMDNSSFAGGIAGYNRGRIASSSGKTISAVSVISGSNYVGGIVGYNDVDGVIQNYELTGGYIQGKVFVGGLIGLNASDDIFGQTMICNLNEVSGTYFVGGIIGGNLVPTDATSVNTMFQTDNFLGSLNANQGAFAGGLIGYNYLLIGSTLPAEIRSAVDRLCEQMKPVPEGSLEETDAELQLVEQPLELLLSTYANTTTIMEINGVGASDSTQTNLAQISALVYVGGVIGYNQDSTKLTIQNMENNTPVTATAYITRTEAGMKEAKKYSYAGGMIGKVAENVTLDHCSNGDKGEVQTQGTYTGGLAEINYGLIKNCTAGSLEREGEDYIGGLVGVNMAGGTKGMENCKLTGTILGQSYVGGLAAENYGRIYQPEIKGGTIIATGEHVGGVTGYGYSESQIELKSGTELDITIEGSAGNVGGLVGSNEGSIEGKDVANGKTSITGLHNVGGFIGVQRKKAETTIEGLRNYADVQAEEGYAGGIVARITKAAEKTSLKNCENFGMVEVLSESLEEIEDEEEDGGSAAGGITAVNRGSIDTSVNYGQVNADNGYAGGIAALNYGKIQHSRVNERGEDTLTLSGNQYVGGIAAKNKEKARIESCSVQKVILQNQEGSESSYLGGIVAENEGTISKCTVGVEWSPETSKDPDYDSWEADAAIEVFEAIKAAGNSNTDAAYSLMTDKNSSVRGSAVVLISNTADVAMGGVAGINTGDIIGDGNKDGYSVVAAELKFGRLHQNDYGYMGGIAGINRGEIRNYEFSGLIHGAASNLSNPPEYNQKGDYEGNGSTIYGYGGIAGLNGNDKQESNAEITNCRVNMAKINGVGTGNNRSNVGGVAGMNGASASISNIQFGDREDLATMKDPAFFHHEITEVADTETTKTVQGTVQVGVDGYGHIGGVVGYNQGEISDINQWNDYNTNREAYFKNGVYGTESRSTEVDKTGVLILADAGYAGGVVGYNRRTGSVQRAVTEKNWLTLAKNQGEDHAVGGIIGYNQAEVNLEYCDNHGTVMKTAVSSTDSSTDSVGGIIGRNENSTNSSWRLYECRNYGSLYADTRAGGIIGQWNYKGGTLENCRNYGSIWAKNKAAGGMVAEFRSMANQENVTITNSQNHGTILTGSTNAYVGGMVGQVDTGMLALKLNACVNTGLIGDNNSKYSAGLVAEALPVNLELNDCRNYGYSQKSGFSGLSVVSGKRTDCFGVTERTSSMNPISQNIQPEETGGYYFTSLEHTEASKYGTPLYVHKKSVGDGYEARTADGTVRISDLGSYELDDILLTTEAGNGKYLASTPAYKLFCELDKYLVMKTEVTSLATPNGIVGSDVDGHYQINWNEVNNAQYYTVESSYYKKQEDGTETGVGTTRSYTTYSNQLKIDAAFSEDGVLTNQVNVQVQAHAKTGEMDTVVDSALSEKTKLKISTLLPAPQVRWELVGDQEECYRIVLDNKKVLEQFVADQNGKIRLEDIEIQMTVQGEALSFPAKDGALTTLQKGIGNTEAQIISYAATKQSGYAQSARAIKEISLPVREDYTRMGVDGSMVLVDLAAGNPNAKVGFYGSTVEHLSYQTAFTTAGWGIAYRTELSAKDPKSGLPIAYAVSAQTRISPTDGELIQVALSGFPADFLDKEGERYRYQDVMVRAYPTKTGNDMGYCGWQVTLPEGKKTMSEAELRSLYVVDTGMVDVSKGKIRTKLISGKKVQDGYVIEYAGPDQYTLYYNTLLKELDKEGYDDKADWSYTKQDQTSVYMYHQVVYHKIELKTALKNTQPEPLILANASYDDNARKSTTGSWKNGAYDETDLFTLTWDQAADGSHLAYTNSNGEIPYEAEGIYDLTVTGTLPNGRITTLVDHKTISTSQVDNGRYNFYEMDASKWEYTNIHASITRIGVTNDSGSTVIFPTTKEVDFPMRTRLSQIGKPTIAMQTDLNGIVQKDGLQYVISWSGLTKEEEINALDYYEVTVSGATTTPDLVIRTEQTMSSQTSVEVNLEHFKRGETISITGKAVAKQSKAYRSGKQGIPREMTVPSRLWAPEMGEEANTGSKMTADVKSMLFVENFESGCMTLRMTPDNYSADNKVNYQIALQVFESKEEAERADGTAVVLDHLPKKSDDNRTYMNQEGDFLTFDVTGIPAKYAGKYLKVMLRSVSSGNISSVWTDEDMEIPDQEGEEGHQAVTPYLIFQLPKVQVDTVKLSNSTELEPVESSVWVDGVEDTTIKTVINQKTLTFTTTEYAEDYHITLIQEAQPADRKAEMKRSEVGQLSLKKQENGSYQVTYESTENAGGQIKQEPFMVTVGGAEEPFSYQKEILLKTEEEKPYVIRAQAYLRAEIAADSDHQGEDETQQVTFTLILPDFSEVEGDESGLIGSGSFTEQVLIRSLVSQKQSDFADSDWAFMARESGEDDLEIQSPISMNEIAQSGNIRDLEASVSTQRGVAYEISSNGLTSATRYLVSAKKGTEELGTFAVPFIKEAEYESTVWLPEWFAKYAGETITLEFCNVFDVTSSEKGGISQWAKQIHTVKLPPLPETSAVTLTQELSTPLTYMVGSNSRLRNGDQSPVTVRQSQISWIYDFEADSRITGYDLTIQGTDENTDYRLQLDLQQDSFGEFPALRAYMAEHQTVLYSILYDLDGDATLADKGDVASPSDSDNTGTVPLATASNSLVNLATDSNIPIGTLPLSGMLRTQFIMDGEEKTGILFTLILPDAAVGNWNGRYENEYLEVYEDGMYRTERLKVEPRLVNRYYALPEEDWFYPEQSLMEVGT